MDVRAAVFESAGSPIRIETIQVDDPGPQEVRVRLVASGVCHSDYHVIKGDRSKRTPLVLGHEGAGVVDAVGQEVTGIAVGDHVALSWVPYCGECRRCRERRPGLCTRVGSASGSGVMLDGSTRFSRSGEPVYSFTSIGAFAEYAVVPASCAIVVRKDAPLDKVAVIGCAVATGVGAVVNTAQVRAGDSVLVIGAGGVGLSVVMGAALVGAGRIIVADVNDSALEKAERLGATHVLNPREVQLEAVISEIVGEDGLDWAFEAIGLKQTIEQAYEVIRPGGTVVVVGQAADGVRVEIDPLVMSDREKSLIGCNYGSCHPALDFPRLIDLFMEGRLDLDLLVARTASLDDINEAFGAMGAGEAARTVILF
ncbi:Zn-dependent alcohol dehydrogenase [Leucobacter sp. GX24907]